mmetsp:Transcript_12983/g.25396  ORF Transcript_12983/g.25396 Transcript_12983/m.25396 type:complete len:257 (-) Transcript_12983:1074-1844(-)
MTALRRTRGKRQRKTSIRQIEMLTKRRDRKKDGQRHPSFFTVPQPPMSPCRPIQTVQPFRLLRTFQQSTTLLLRNIPFLPLPCSFPQTLYFFCSHFHLLYLHPLPLHYRPPYLFHDFLAQASTAIPLKRTPQPHSRSHPGKGPRDHRKPLEDQIFHPSLEPVLHRLAPPPVLPFPSPSSHPAARSPATMTPQMAESLPKEFLGRRPQEQTAARRHTDREGQARRETLHPDPPAPPQQIPIPPNKRDATCPHSSHPV